MELELLGKLCDGGSQRRRLFSIVDIGRPYGVTIGHKTRITRYKGILNGFRESGVVPHSTDQPMKIVSAGK